MFKAEDAKFPTNEEVITVFVIVLGGAEAVF
jgi:hypothetical protein